MRLGFTLIIFFSIALSGYCGHDIYSFQTYGNLSAKIEHSKESLTTDKAFKCVEYCSYITNELIPEQKVYIEIYTLRLDEKDDFFVSYGNGKKESYINYNQTDRKGNTKAIREYEKTDSLDSERLIIRYVTLNPDYKKLTRLVYESINQIDFIKSNQKKFDYKWFNNYWIIKSADSLKIRTWLNNVDNDHKINAFLTEKSYSSVICENHSDFPFTYIDSDTSVTIIRKSSKDNLLFIDKLSWFAILTDFGIFFDSDSTFYIADSEKQTLSQRILIPVSISDNKMASFSQKSKYAVEFSVMNFDNENYNHETHSWIYGTENGKLIDVSNLTEKEINRMSKKKYWH
jgi:hypothetical protein